MRFEDEFNIVVLISSSRQTERYCKKVNWKKGKKKNMNLGTSTFYILESTLGT